MITRRDLLTRIGLSLAWLGVVVAPSSSARPKYNMDSFDDRLAAAREIEDFIWKISGKKWQTICPSTNPQARAFIFHEK